MALTGIQLSSGIVLGAPKPLDVKYGPFSSTAEANSLVSNSLRYKGLTVGILESGIAVEYWYREGITDSDLILKTGALDSATTAELDDLKDKTQNISLDTDVSITHITGDVQLTGSLLETKIDAGTY